MNWDRIESDWGSFREIVKLHWSRLSDKQLEWVDGKRERLVEAIQGAYRMSNGDAERQLANWQASHQRESERLA